MGAQKPVLQAGEKHSPLLPLPEFTQLFLVLFLKSGVVLLKLAVNTFCVFFNLQSRAELGPATARGFEGMSSALLYFASLFQARFLPLASA